MATIQHKNIVDADLHEPKGAATAISKQVYVANGAGSGVWTKYFESSEQALVTSSAVSVSHGLGGVPARAELVLRCKTTDFGYAVGDEIIPSSFSAGDSFSLSWGCQVVRDATNVGFTVAPQGILSPTKTGGGGLATLTLANWKGVLRAWSF